MTKQDNTNGELDLLKGLPLTHIASAPPIRKLTDINPQAMLPMQTDGLAESDTGVTAAQKAGVQTKGQGKPSVLDSVIYALTGTPDALLTPEDSKARAGRRAEAGRDAAQAANQGGDVADKFMGAPGTGGSGFGLGDIVSFASKLFGKGIG